MQMNLGHIKINITPILLLRKLYRSIILVTYITLQCKRIPINIRYPDIDFIGDFLYFLKHLPCFIFMLSLVMGIALL